MMADVIQARGGRPVGFANPSLYDRAGTRAFHDVNDAAVHTARGNVVDLGTVGGQLKVRLYKIGADQGLAAAKGYDTATGVGSRAPASSSPSACTATTARTTTARVTSSQPG